MDDSKMKFLELLKQHGETIQKFALGGETLGGPTVTTQGGSPKMGGIGGDFGKYTGVGQAFNGLNDLTQNHFQASGAALQPGTNAVQLNNSYDQAMGGIDAQSQFMNALQAQNGIGNQSQTYNQMQNIAAGVGPNPAQAMLNQATGANVANQAALIASQRGASANAGLMARQAAQQGAGIQQNAAGQAATMQANQSLNAINNAANIAQNQVNQQGQATQGFNTAVQNEQNILQGANSAFNNANVGMQSNLNNVNGMISQGNQQAGNALTGGIIKGISSAFGGFAEGGEVDANVGSGNYTPVFSSSAPNIGSASTSADEGSYMAGKSSPGGAKSSPTASGGGGGSMASVSDLGSLSKFATMAAQGGEIPEGGPRSMAAKHLNGTAPTKPEPQKLNPNTPGPTLESILGLSSKSAVAGMSGGGEAQFMDALKAKAGGKVPGKPKHPGVNTEENDVVPALLTPKEVVLPLTVTQSENAPEAAKQFMIELMKKNKMACGGAVQKMADGGEAKSGQPSEEELRARIQGVGDTVSNAWNTGKDVLFGRGVPALYEEAPKTAAPAPAQASGLQEGAESGRVPTQEIGPTNVNLGTPAPTNPIQGAGLIAQNPADFKYDPYKGLNTQLTGIQGEAKAVGQLEDEKAKIFAKQAEDEKMINDQAMKNANDYKIESDHMINDMKLGHIDPKAYMNNMSGGQKLSTAIGLILGGIGGGIDRTGVNPAMEFLNKQIQNDIQAQVENRNNKNTIFGAMEKQYGNKQDALKMTHAFYLAKLQNDLNTAAARTGSQLAIARAQQASGPIQQQLSQLHFDVGMRQAAMQGGAGGADPSMLVRYLVPKEHQAKAFEEIEVAQNTAKNAPMILKAFDGAAKQHMTDYVPGTLNADQKSFHALLGPTFQDVEGTVRQAAMDNMYSNTTPQFGDSASTLAKKRATVENYLKYKESAPVAKGYGIDLQKFRTTKVGGSGFKKRD